MNRFVRMDFIGTFTDLTRTVCFWGSLSRADRAMTDLMLIREGGLP